MAGTHQAAQAARAAVMQRGKGSKQGLGLHHTAHQGGVMSRRE
jgi:hypothetical protein